MMARAASAVHRLATAWAAAMAAGAVAGLLYVQLEFGEAGHPLLAGAALALAPAAVLLLVIQWRPWPALAAVAGLALALRIAAAIWLDGRVPQNDPLSYLVISHSIIAGEGMAAWDVRAYYPPLYPLLLGLTRFAVPDPGVAIPLLNAIIDGIGALLLYRLGLRWLDSRSAAVAAAAWLLWPSALVTSAIANKEGLTVTLFLTFVLALAAWTEEQRWRHAAAAGIAWGLLALAQPALVLLPLFLFAAVPLASGRAAREVVPAMLLAGACACAVLSPWCVRNYLLFGTFVPFTTVGGLAFVRLVPMEVFALGASDMMLDEAGRGAAYARQALAWIAANPVEYVVNVALRAARGLLLDIGGAQQLALFRPQPAGATVAALIGLTQLAAAALWAAAAVALWRRATADRPLLPALLVATAAHVLLVSMWVVFYDRHRQVLTPIAILAAVALVRPSSGGDDGGAGASPETRQA